MSKTTIAVWGRDTAPLTGFSGWLSDWLAQAGEQPQGQSLGWRTAKEARAALSDDARGFYIVLFESAACAVAENVADGAAPSDALQTWKDRASELLRFYKSHRRRLLIMSPRHALAFSDTLQPELGRFLKLPDAPQMPPPAPLDLPGLPQWAHVIGAHSVANNAEARRLQGELEAAMLPLPKIDPDQDAAAREMFSKELALKELRRDKDQLREAITKQQDQHKEQAGTQAGKIAALESQLRAAEQKNAELRRQRDAAQSKFEQSEKQLTRVTAENTRLVSHLGAVRKEALEHRMSKDATHQRLQEAEDVLSQLEGEVADCGTDLASAQDRAKTAAEENETLQARLQESQAEIHSLRTSTSWRVTGFLRRFKRALDKVLAR